jgi:hypothetical protein
VCIGGRRVHGSRIICLYVACSALNAKSLASTERVVGTGPGELLTVARRPLGTTLNG